MLALVTDMRQPWQYENPSCREIGDPDYWIEESVENQRIAKRICTGCEHKIECAEYAITHEVIGIWGGLSTKERATIASRRRVVRIPIMMWPTSPKRREQTNDQ